MKDLAIVKTLDGFDIVETSQAYSASPAIKNVVLHLTDAEFAKLDVDYHAFNPVVPEVPVLTSISPSHVLTGNPAFGLTVTGVGFSTTSTVQIDGHPVPTTYVSSGELTADLPAVDASVPMVHQVTVVTPAPGGGTSSAATLTVSVAPVVPVK
jgi:hypothetical protein